MPAPSWGEDSPQDETTIASNVTAVLRAIVQHGPHRHAPTLGLAHQWHRDLFAGVHSVPRASYLGTPRGSKDPDLKNYEVVLGHRATARIYARGVPAAEVADQLRIFEAAIHHGVTVLDEEVPPGTVLTERELFAVVEFAAVAHGEWVRIHPYANGNGRTARLWANWVAVRYRLPPFVRIKPRPGGLLYAQAAQASMADAPDHSVTASVFLELLRDGPGG